MSVKLETEKYMNYKVFFNSKYISKLNSNPYHYKPKFILMSKQKYNSKFQEFEIVRTLKIHFCIQFVF